MFILDSQRIGIALRNPIGDVRLISLSAERPQITVTRIEERM